MPSDYAKIRQEHIEYYGKGFAEYAPRLLHDLYALPAHFIFELLQNAEDALARRGKDWQGRRTVSFDLTGEMLRVSHWGAPFNERDVRGVCAIGETTKELTDIGRFGIGFKSVYKFTDSPEIHSGDENFAIEKYVRPEAVAPVVKDPDETVILMPLKSGISACDTIISGLEKLGASSLLFLRHINEVRWTLDGNVSGHYLRESKSKDNIARRTTVIGEQHGKPEEAEEYLVFSRPVRKNDIGVAGSVEIAFVITDNKIRKVQHSPVVAYFPTVKETNLGFLIQGPYRTNSARNDIPSDDDWNRHLIKETASLLPDALLWLRDNNCLSTDALRCLPLDENKFGEASLFKPLFDAAKRALASECLLPRHSAGYTPAKTARLAGSGKLRELFAPSQLAALCGEKGKLAWLSGGITSDRARDLYDYIRHQLNVAEIDGEWVARHLNSDFLERQPDPWVQNLYEFFGEQPRLQRQLSGKPIVRLEDGRHVPAQGAEKVFLPGNMKTDFPTVCAAVCQTKEARAFLATLGLEEPNPADDIIHNILPKYQQQPIVVGNDEYNGDIARIIKAAKTDKISLRNKLISALKKTPFVKGVNAGDGEQKWLEPGQAYLPIERLRGLFAGVDGVCFVDDSCGCLHGSGINALLKDCGAAERLKLVSVDSHINAWDSEAAEWRKKSGHPGTTGRTDYIKDWNIDGLDLLLEKMQHQPEGDVKIRAKLLWDEIAYLTEGHWRCFEFEYTWTDYGYYSATGPSAFVRLLQKNAWIPDGKGGLSCPDDVLFGSLGWNENPALQKAIGFQPPDIESLAEKTGVPLGAIALFKKLNLTEDGLRKLLDLSGTKPGDAIMPPESTIAPATKNAPKKTNASAPAHRGVEFVSYVRVEKDKPEEGGEPKSGGKTREQILGDKAVAAIRESEQWQVAPPNNKGYDLYQTGDNGEAVCWCEVKGLSGGWDKQPVALTHSQFEFAQEKQDAFWLYVVEYADTNPRITRIQNPAGRGSRFVFDDGWREAEEK